MQDISLLQQKPSDNLESQITTEAQFKFEMESHCLRPTRIVADGKIHRCPVDGNPTGKDGAYLLHLDHPASGWWKNWRTGEESTWSPNNHITLSKVEQRNLARRIEADKRQREQNQTERHAEAAKRAAYILDQAKCCRTHTYLIRKGVAPCQGLKTHEDGALLVPVLGPDGIPQSLQTIMPDGTKRFLTGGKMSGGFFPIGDAKEGPLLICEGLATGLSLHEATKHTVLVAFNAGNLSPVAKLARKRYPERPITICGDDDRQTGGNPGRIKAQDAAFVIDGKVALPVFSNDIGGTDFNDLHQAEGLDAVKAQVEAAKEPNIPQQVNVLDDWPEPVPLVYQQKTPLPVTSLPDWGARYVDEVSNHLQVASCLTMANLLGAVSTAIAKKFRVEIKPGYIEPLNLYILAPAPPAERKTAAQAKIFAPIYEWERDKAKNMKQEIAEAASKRKSQEAIIASLRNKLGRSEDQGSLIEDIARMEANLPEIIHSPRLIGDDITPEALASLMALHDQRLGIVSTEGGIFDTLAGRYNSGVANLDLVLKAHANEAVRVDRKSGHPVMMDSPSLTLCLSPQPEVLTNLMNKPGFRGRGLLGRFIYVLPESRLGRRLIDTPAISQVCQDTYRSALRRLLELPWSTNEYGDPVGCVLYLDQAAYRSWIEFAQWIERELAGGGKFETVTDWAGKLPGLSARLAGNLHVMEHQTVSPKNKLSQSTMDCALELAVALAGHALAAFELMGTDPGIEAARYCLAWITRQGIEQFTQRDCHRGVRGRYAQVDQVRAALSILEDRGYIQALTRSSPKRSGRKNSPSYLINPKIRKV